MCKLDNKWRREERMRKVLCEIFSNRLGNTLAIANFVLIAINSSGITMWFGLRTWILFSGLISVPARIASAIFFGNPLIPYDRGPAGVPYFALGTLVFIYLQWITIGWIARKISQSIQPRLSKLL